MYVIFALVLLVVFAIARALVLYVSKMPGLATATGAAISSALLAGVLLGRVMGGHGVAGGARLVGAAADDPSSSAPAPASASSGGPLSGVAMKPRLEHLSPARIDALSQAAADGVGSIDTLDAAGAPPGGTFPRGKPLIVSGWTADSKSHEPATGIFLIVDGRKRVDATASYGISRTDVARFFGTNTMEDTGFQGVALPTIGLARGAHTLQLAAIDAGGSSYYVVKKKWTFELR